MNNTRLEVLFRQEVARREAAEKAERDQRVAALRSSQSLPTATLPLPPVPLQLEQRRRVHPATVAERRAPPVRPRPRSPVSPVRRTRPRIGPDYRDRRGEPPTPPTNPGFRRGRPSTIANRTRPVSSSSSSSNESVSPVPVAPAVPPMRSHGISLTSLNQPRPNLMHRTPPVVRAEPTVNTPLPRPPNNEHSAFTCPVCFEEYSSNSHPPVTLQNCGHTVCRLCLAKLRHCALCNRAIQMTGVSATSVPPNYTLLHLREEMDTTHREALQRQSRDFEKKLADARDEKLLLEQQLRARHNGSVLCAACKDAEKETKMLICMQCANGNGLTETSSEEELMPFVLCAACTLENHKEHQMIKYVPWKSHQLVTTAATDAVGNVGGMVELCDDIYKKAKEDMDRWVGRVTHLKDTGLANRTDKSMEAAQEHDALIRRDADTLSQLADRALPHLRMMSKVATESCARLDNLPNRQGPTTKSTVVKVEEEEEDDDDSDSDDVKPEVLSIASSDSQEVIFVHSTDDHKKENGGDDEKNDDDITVVGVVAKRETPQSVRAPQPQPTGSPGGVRHRPTATPGQVENRLDDWLSMCVAPVGTWRPLVAAGVATDARRPNANTHGNAAPIVAATPAAPTASATPAVPTASAASTSPAAPFVAATSAASLSAARAQEARFFGLLSQNMQPQPTGDSQAGGEQLFKRMRMDDAVVVKQEPDSDSD